MHPSESAEPAALIGIDWADEGHETALLDPECGTIEHARLEHSPEAIAEWAGELRRRFGGRSVAVGLEQSRGPLIYALLEYEFLTLYPIPPLQLRRFREAFQSSGAKSDPTDAEFVLELLEKHGDRLRVWRPDDEPTRALRRLAEHRRKASTNAPASSSAFGPN